MTAYLYLLAAILFEVIGTTFFRLSEGFEKWAWGLSALVLYVVSLGFLSIAMKTIPMTVSQPLWAGLGTGLIVLIGMFGFNERLTGGQWLGILLTVVGVILVRVMAPEETAI